MIESMYQETKESMQKSIDALKNEFKKVSGSLAFISWNLSVKAVVNVNTI